MALRTTGERCTNHSLAVRGFLGGTEIRFLPGRAAREDASMIGHLLRAPGTVLRWLWLTNTASRWTAVVALIVASQAAASALGIGRSHALGSIAMLLVLYAVIATVFRRSRSW